MLVEIERRQIALMMSVDLSMTMTAAVPKDDFVAQPSKSMVRQ
jgi:hypothetical protein